MGNAERPYAVRPDRLYTRDDLMQGWHPGGAPGGASLAIPTWMIAGEPISQFAWHIAKYFSNSIREDGMLAVATAALQRQAVRRMRNAR